MLVALADDCASLNSSPTSEQGLPCRLYSTERRKTYITGMAGSSFLDANLGNLRNEGVKL